MAITVPTTPARQQTSTALVPAGFTQVRPVVKKRLVMSIEGDWGTGKTDLALTAPGPIAFFKFDLNTEFTLSKYADAKLIYQREYEVIDPADAHAQTKAEAMMKAFALDYASAIQSTQIRTVVWDTATEVWEQFRLAWFGKLTSVQPHHYVQINNAFRMLIRAAFDSDTNLIMIHRLKDEWQNYTDAKTGQERGKKTGRKERAGFGDLGFAVQVMVQTYFDPENTASPFQMKVLKCTQNPLITHRIYGLAGEFRMNSFPILAADVFPGSQLSEWE